MRFAKPLAVTKSTPRQVGAGSPFAQIDFAYDLADNLIRESYRRPSTTGGWTTGGDKFYYDDFHRLTEAWLGLDAAGMAAEPPSDITDNYKERTKYGLDAGGNRATLDFLSGTEQYVRTYSLEDDGGTETANRYDEWTQGAATTEVEHDAEGNLWRIGDTYFVFDIFNRLSEVYKALPPPEQSSSSSPSAPSAGLLQLRRQDFDYARKRIWLQIEGGYAKLARDHESLANQGKLTYRIQVRLKSASASSSSSTLLPVDVTLVAAYTYDVFDRRVSRFVYDEYGQSTLYFHTYDGWRELEEVVIEGSAPATQKGFVWGDRLDELLAFVHADGQGGYVSTFVHQSGADSTHVLMDGQGNEVERWEYRASGEPEVYKLVSGSYQLQPGGSTVGLPYGWHGKRHDPETGLVYNRHRYFSPVMGRFVSVDPIGAWGDGINWGNGYGFAGASMLRMDPLGLQAAIYYSPGSPGAKQNHRIHEVFKSGRLGLGEAVADLAHAIAGVSAHWISERPNGSFGDGLNGLASGVVALLPEVAQLVTGGYWWSDTDWGEAVRGAVGLGSTGTKADDVGSLVAPIGAVFKALKWALKGSKFGKGVKATKASGLCVKITAKEIDDIAEHLRRLDVLDDPPNAAMMRRPRTGERTDQDLRFFEHERIESGLMDEGMNARDAHLETLRRQGIPYEPGYERQLYHPDVISEFPQHFNPANWR